MRTAATIPFAVLLIGCDPDCPTSPYDTSADTGPDTSATRTVFEDTDGDGFGDPATSEAIPVSQALPEGYVENSGDCDDENSARHPDAQEVCDGLDNDCDGLVDDDDDSVSFTAPHIGYRDRDGDGFHGGGLVAVCDEALVSETHSDCDDTDSSVYPGAPELCNGVDDNCDGSDDTLGYWPFDERDGDVAYGWDSQGTNGVVVGATRSLGVSGFALDFEEGAHVRVENEDGRLEPSDAMSVSLWVQMDDLRSDYWVALLTLGSLGGDYNGYFFGYYEGQPIFRMDLAGEHRSVIAEGTDHLDGAWHHLVGTWDSASTMIRLYVDGVFVGETEGPINLWSDGAPLRIGVDTNGGEVEPDTVTDGRVDEVKLFSCALDADQVHADYHDNWPF